MRPIQHARNGWARNVRVLTPASDSLIPIMKPDTLLSLRGEPNQEGQAKHMIHLSGVTKTYLGNSRVLDQVNLDLKRGDFLYVVGGSGAGKSSLLRMIATEEEPSSGKLALFGFDLRSVTPSTLRSIRRSIGYVPQNVRLIPDLTIYENIALSASLARKSLTGAELRNRVSELLERLELAAKRDQPANRLSGGEAQRVAVARALIRSPELIVADEPTGAQDRESTWSLLDLFLKANVTGATVVIATHDREIVRRVRKRCAILKGGRVVVESPGLGLGLGNPVGGHP
jgi:cell division transport system ATP-binding protein